MTTPLILIVDNNRTELEQLVGEVGTESYTAVGAASLEEMDAAMAEKRGVALVVLDITGFDESIWERCERLHQAGIPFAIIAPQRSPGILRDSMKYGASCLLIKPVGIKELVEYIHTILGD